MNAATVAKQIRAMGFPIMSYEEGSERLDGQVTVNDLVHVQVPTYGTGLVVNRFDGEAMHHFPVRSTPDQLREDIDQAIKDAAQFGTVAPDVLTFDVLCNGDVLYQVTADDFNQAQAGVDQEFGPNACVVFFAEGEDHLRQRAVDRSKELAERALALAA